MCFCKRGLNCVCACACLQVERLVRCSSLQNQLHVPACLPEKLPSLIPWEGKPQTSISVPPNLQISDLPARELVPGDIVELHVGDRVPADLRLLQLRTATVRAEQASLTGVLIQGSRTSWLG